VSTAAWSKCEASAFVRPLTRDCMLMSVHPLARQSDEATRSTGGIGTGVRLPREQCSGQTMQYTREPLRAILGLCVRMWCSYDVCVESLVVVWIQSYVTGEVLGVTGGGILA
jgi:hypothetical protein